jgi:hypothetical protein
MGIHKSCRHAPLPFFGPPAAFNEEELVSFKDNGSNGDFGVGKMNPPAFWAGGVEFMVVNFTFFDPNTAVWAETYLSFFQISSFF